MPLYRIYLEYVPCSNGASEILAGWFGGIPHSTNAPIYCRVPDKKNAYTYDRGTTISLIRNFSAKGYPCFSDPPIYLKM